MEEGRSLTQEQLPPLSEAVDIEVGALAELQAQHCSRYDVGSYFSTLRVCGTNKSQLPCMKVLSSLPCKGFL